MSMTQGENQEVIDFVNQGIASGNIDMMNGIAETVTDLSDLQIKELLFSGSLEVTKTLVLNLNSGASIFADIDKIALTAESIEAGATVQVTDEDGVIIDPFKVHKQVCGEEQIEDQDPALRYAKDNIARVCLEKNADGIAEDTVTLKDVVFQIESTLLSNQNTPTEIVTEYLTSESDKLRAKAFVHKNTENAAIISTMQAEDSEGNNIDGFKLAMIEDLKTEEMIIDNVEIVKYLLGENQSAPVQYEMFKNYSRVLMNGGTAIDGIDIERLIETFVK